MRFGITQDFRNPPQWRRPFPELYADLMAQVRYAELLGYDNVWLTEHHFTEDGYNPALLTTAAAIAAQTQTIRIGTFILLLPYQHPVRATEDVASVDILSNGRFDFGVGQGYSYHEFNALCLDRSTRARRLYEALEIYRRLHTEEEVSFDGEFTRIDKLRLSPRSVQQPHPPIWIGARGPRGIRRAAEHGHHLMATFGPDPAPLYLDSLRACGRDPDAFRIAQLRMIYIADSEDQAWDECQDHLFHLLEFYQDILAEARDAEGDDAPLPVSRPEDMRHSVLKDVFMIGTVQQVADKLDTFASEYTCTDLVTYMQFPGMDVTKGSRSMERFAREIMPAFRNR
jgi:alkanesulfonate monooxygenase SsuD/methylene tetrahydromethanopterin reductase-like flavin-dependent oxidoreductase (luciferase family)